MRVEIESYATRRSVALALAAGTMLALAGVAGAVPRPAPTVKLQADISGTARIIDGDTIDVGDVRIRLEGIDAPEKGQRCARRWFGTWGCGEMAIKQLNRMLAGRTVSCEARGHDKYGRVLGVCSVDGDDINARLVRDGLAWAFVKYSQRYVREEAEARASKRGVFATVNQPPWDYRARAWSTAEQRAPEGCAIKGNVSSKGRIYHMPWSPWYQRVTVESGRGERWFCSEAEAIRAGWQASRN